MESIIADFEREIVRDVCLASAGLLSPKMGGPPVNPPQPDGVMTLGQSKHAWKPSEDEDRYRRGIYTQFFRATPHPALNVFDAPDAFSACTRRIRSNTPLQALTLLNDQQFYELAQALGTRVLRDVGESDADRLEYAFRLCLTRRPGPDEAKRMLDFIAQTARDVGLQDYNVLVNVGEGAGQTIFHLHWHILGGHATGLP